MKFALHAVVAAVLSCLAGSANASGFAIHAVDAQGKPLADVVLYAEADSAPPASKPPQNVEIEQNNLTFLPLVTVIQTGSRITFPNHDKVRHHIYSFSPAKRFNQKLYSGESAAPQIFDKAGTVVLGCNIHDAMLAYIRIVDTPYFAKTNAAGDATFEAPAGKYTLRAWHYNMASIQPLSQTIQIKAGDALTATTVKLLLKRILVNPNAPSDSSN